MRVKYEVKILSVHLSNKDDELEKAQNDGWEIAGQILLSKRPTGSIDIYIPLKRGIT